MTTDRTGPLTSEHAKLTESAGQDTNARRLSLAPPAREVIEVGPEDVLTAQEVDLLQRAESGKVSCPWCGQPLMGEFLYYDLENDDFYAGVRLSCGCGFVEY